MQISTDFSMPVRSVTLGNVSLPVSDYSLQTDVPVKMLTLCDGQPYPVFLGTLPCTLSLRIVLPAADVSQIIRSLNYPLHNHTPFDFDFEQIRFSQMRLTALSCKTAQHDPLASLSLTLMGVVKH
ncbi:MAG TPA: hypothetical protein DCG49_06685 [Ruminococcus sp.]|nr:hypothetical protein [Ruminococcus sp.]